MPPPNSPSCAELAACGPGQGRGRNRSPVPSLSRPGSGPAKFALRRGFAGDLESGLPFITAGEG